MTTIYRTRITHLPPAEGVPDAWRVELMTHTEDGLNVEFEGEFFEEAEAKAIMAAWRNPETRPIIFASMALTRPDWHEEGEE